MIKDLQELVRISFVVISVATFATAVNAQTLTIYHIDVDQGDATLFVSPTGRTMLVDSGPNRYGNLIKTVMDQASITQIDVFVCTHYHLDHYGSIDELINEEGVTVTTTFDRGDKELPDDNGNLVLMTKFTQNRGLEYFQSVGQNAVHLTRGMQVPFDTQNLSVNCISSGGVVLGETEHHFGTDENDMSLSLLIQFGDFRYFIGGDIEVTTEGKISSRDLVMDVDVYQANHHASHTSSSVPFMEDLSPAAIIISNGNHGGHQHPRQHTLNTYGGLDPEPVVFQTNKYLKGGHGGNVPDEFILDLTAAKTPGAIVLTVDLATDSYTIEYRTFTRQFAIKSRGNLVSNSVVIESVLPNPVGVDSDLEEVTIHNNSSQVVQLTGWVLRDASGRIWSLSTVGAIASGQSIVVRRNGMAMSLNNGGDDVFLVGASNQIVDRFTYNSSVEGVSIPTNH